MAPPPPAPRRLPSGAPAQARPQAPGRRLQALLALRHKQLKERAGCGERLGRAGGVRALLALLLPPPRGTSRELEIGLSVLANCCTQAGPRREVRLLGGIAPLVDILKGINTLCVQNRVARALGNLALEAENSVIIHQSGAVPHLIGLLSSVEDSSCLQTVARTLRILADSPAHRSALTSQGCVPPLLALLGRRRPGGGGAGEQQQQQEEPKLLGAVARALAELTHSCTAPCALQVCRHGGVPLLASLASCLEPGRGSAAAREGALAALANLCGQGFARPSVGGAGGVGLLVSALRSEPGAPGAQLLLRALCLCCREAVNRARVRQEGGLDLLLALLREPAHRASHHRIIGALLGFFYDQAAMDHLHSRGLVPLLLSKLVSLAAQRSGGGGRAPHPARRHRHRPYPARQGGGQRHPEEEEEEEEEPLDEREAASFDYPPERPIEGEEQQQEASSSFRSLRSWLVSEGYIESLDDVLPSPPGEPENPYALLSSPGEPEAGAADRLGEASPAAIPGPPASAAPPSEPCLPEAPVLLLLSRFSQAEEPAPGLVTERSLRALLDYLSLARPPGARCSRLLARLACNPNCLEALVRARAVPLLRAQLVHGLRPAPLPERPAGGGGGGGGGDWTPTRRNRELGEILLRNISVQAESPFGVGTLTHLLLSGCPSDRESCAIAVPLLCRNETLRRKLLLDHSGLHFLLETLLSSEDQLASFGAADGLACLVGAPGEVPAPLRARPPQKEEEEEEAADSAAVGAGPPRCPYRELVGRGAADLRLALEGGARLPAIRARLSRASEFFRAMLGGGYLESRQSEVALGGLGAEEAEVLLHHLHGCRADSGCPRLAALGGEVGEGQGLEEEEEEEEGRFEDSLLGRALAASSQYLLSDLTSALERAAYGRCPPGRLPALSRFARRHHLLGLRALCLRGLLGAPMGPCERARAWRGLAAGAGEREEVLPALHALLLEHV